MNELILYDTQHENYIGFFFLDRVPFNLNNCYTLKSFFFFIMSILKDFETV